MRKIIIALSFWLIASCANQAPSVAEGIATGYITVETLAESVATASDKGLITPANRAYAKVQLQTAKNVLDTGTELLKLGKEVEAQISLNRANNAIHNVQGLLP